MIDWPGNNYAIEDRVDALLKTRREAATIN